MANRVSVEIEVANPGRELSRCRWSYALWSEIQPWEDRFELDEDISKLDEGRFENREDRSGRGKGRFKEEHDKGRSRHDEGRSKQSEGKYGQSESRYEPSPFSFFL